MRALTNLEQVILEAFHGEGISENTCLADVSINGVPAKAICFVDTSVNPPTMSPMLLLLNEDLQSVVLPSAMPNIVSNNDVEQS